MQCSAPICNKIVPIETSWTFKGSASIADWIYRNSRLTALFETQIFNKWGH